MHKKYDFVLTGRPTDTVFLLRPMNKKAAVFLDEVAPDAITFGDGIAIEHRYVETFIESLDRHGWTVVVEG